MRDFDKEYSDWKKDIYTVLIMGFVLGLIAGILIQSGGGMKVQRVIVCAGYGRRRPHVFIYA